MGGSLVDSAGFSIASRGEISEPTPPTTWKPITVCVDEIMTKSRHHRWGFTAEHEAAMLAAPDHAGLNSPTCFNLQPNAIFGDNWRQMWWWLEQAVSEYNRTYNRNMQVFSSINVDVTSFGRRRHSNNGLCVEPVCLEIVEANGDPLQGRDGERCLPGIELILLLALNPHMISIIAPNTQLGAMGLSAYNTDNHAIPSFSYEPDGAGEGKPECYFVALHRPSHLLAYRNLPGDNVALVSDNKAALGT